MVRRMAGLRRMSGVVVVVLLLLVLLLWRISGGVAVGLRRVVRLLGGGRWQRWRRRNSELLWWR